MSEQTELKVVKKSMELVEHTFVLTSNLNRYPKKYRYSLVPRIQDVSMDIYERLMEANRINVQQQSSKRYQMQTEVIMLCDKLLYYIELSQHLNLLSYKSMKYWSKMVCDVKYMALAWRKQSK